MAARPAPLRRRRRRKVLLRRRRRLGSIGRTSSFEVPHINDRRVVELAERLGPDLIAVFGTSLIRGPLLGMGRLGIVNLHGGLSPEYRGADCTFWALYNGEPEKVGCTIHFIDRGIDTGNLIAHVSPEVKPGDDELTLFWRAVKESADVYAELLRTARARRVLRPEPARQGQAVSGEGPWAAPMSASSSAGSRDGMLDGVELPKRVTWFVRPTECAAVSSRAEPSRMRDIAVTAGRIRFAAVHPQAAVDRHPRLDAGWAS